MEQSKDLEQALKDVINIADGNVKDSFNNSKKALGVLDKLFNNPEVIKAQRENPEVAEDLKKAKEELRKIQEIGKNFKS